MSHNEYDVPRTNTFDFVCITHSGKHIIYDGIYGNDLTDALDNVRQAAYDDGYDIRTINQKEKS